MSDEDALLAAIAAHPAEDTPRLAFADWLDEHDCPIRAEFIRLQIDIARKQDTLPRVLLNHHVDLFKRNQELLDNHRDELLGPLAPLAAGVRVEFRRGFVSLLDLPVREFLARSALVAGLRPLPWVRVTGVRGQALPFLLNPDTGCVAEISGFSEAPDDQPPQYPDDLEFFELIERLTKLQVLDLETCGINDLHCDLAFNFSVPSLIDLDLSNNDITDRGIQDLLRTDLPGQLKRLILGANPITDIGARWLAEGWPAKSPLENLNLRFTGIGQPGQQALLARFGGKIDLF